MAADPKPLPSPEGELNFDDDEIDAGSRGARSGGTWNTPGADSGRIAPPAEILSDENGPSDTDRGGKPRAGRGGPGAT